MRDSGRDTSVADDQAVALRPLVQATERHRSAAIHPAGGLLLPDVAPQLPRTAPLGAAAALIRAQVDPLEEDAGEDQQPPGLPLAQAAEAEDLREPAFGPPVVHVESRLAAALPRRPQPMMIQGMPGWRPPRLRPLLCGPRWQPVRSPGRPARAPAPAPAGRGAY